MDRNFEQRFLTARRAYIARQFSHMNQRLSEAARLGFRKCLLPRGGSEKLEIPHGLTVYRVRNLSEAIETAL